MSNVLRRTNVFDGGEICLSKKDKDDKLIRQLEEITKFMCSKEQWEEYNERYGNQSEDSSD